MNLPNHLLAQYETMPTDMPEVSPAILLIPLIIGILFAVVICGVMWWGMFTKAGKPGWASLIPIYNVVIWMDIIGRPRWWVLLCLIPLVNIIITILACIDTAKSFGKEAGFGIGLWLLGIIFFPILSWGSDKYVGPAAKTA